MDLPSYVKISKYLSAFLDWDMHVLKCFPVLYETEKLPNFYLKKRKTKEKKGKYFKKVVNHFHVFFYFLSSYGFLYLIREL